jgi:hypothetical protein
MNCYLLQLNCYSLAVVLKDYYYYYYYYYIIQENGNLQT